MDVLIKIKFKDNLASPPRYSLPSPWMCRKKIYKLTLRAGLPRNTGLNYCAFNGQCASFDRQILRRIVLMLLLFLINICYTFIH